MSKLTPLPYHDVIKKLKKAGFIFRRAAGGTHEIWWNEKTKKTAVVPHHQEIAVGTLNSIIRQMGVGKEEFLELK